jgi:surface polysaccharide O-acyltransferase-like enzyme
MNLSVDLVRTVAIVLVVLVHVTAFPFSIQGLMTSTAMFDWWTTDVFGAVANLSVPLFIMLSGVLLLNPEKADEPLRVFFKKRLTRIGVPIVFWTVAYFAWNYYLHGFSFSPTNVVEGLLSGSYYHLWFLYLLVGLYMATPVLRVLVKNLDHRRFRYFLTLWVIGTFTIPFINAFGGLGFNADVFIFVGWVGYFLLGVFLLQTQVSRRLLYACLVGGLAATVVADGFVPAVLGANFMGFFHQPLNFTLVLSSAALFMLLIHTETHEKASHHPTIHRLISWISKNTLPIYLLHIMVLEALENGYLGLSLNMTVLSPILEIPLLTLVTFALTALIVYPLKEIPVVNQLIG